MASSGNPFESWTPEWADREVPFICVASQGGRYADLDFAAGHFIGGLVEKLRVASVSGTVPLDVAVPADLIPQIDLIAMKFGYMVSPRWEDQFYSYIPITCSVARDIEDTLGDSNDREEPGTEDE